MTVSQSALVFHELDKQVVLVRYSVEYLLIWTYFSDVTGMMSFFVTGHRGSHHHRRRSRSLCGQGNVSQVSSLQKLPIFSLSSFYSLEASHLV